MMLEQFRADELIRVEKQLVDVSTIDFPPPGATAQLEGRSVDGKELFVFDVNRRGRIKLSKCTYQERYAVVTVLLRLDVDGPSHENPDGIEIPCPHLHRYREGYGDKWASHLPLEFTNTTDLVQTLREFLEYCRVTNIPEIQRSIL